MDKPTLPEELLANLDKIAAEATKSGPRQKKDVPSSIKAKPRKTRMTREESFRRLDHFDAEARAGMPDDALARQASVPEIAVLAWRKARDIKRPRGHAARKLDSAWAMKLFAAPFDPQIQTTESVINGLWEPPEYVLRTPLNYTEFARHVYGLHLLLGSGPQVLSKALGVREKDVELALAVWKGHLRKTAVNCHCGNPTDPSYGRYCSTICRPKEKS